MFDKPFVVRFWEAHPGTPRCCHTCASFSNGDVPTCTRTDVAVEETFAATCDACPKWRDKEGGMPF